MLQFTAFPIDRNILHQFLLENNSETKEITTKHIIVSRNSQEISIPWVAELTLNDMKDILNKGDLSFSEFEYYIQHHSNDFKSLKYN